jgi:SOS regulatory protein LexA
VASPVYRETFISTRCAREPTRGQTQPSLRQGSCADCQRVLSLGKPNPAARFTNTTVADGLYTVPILLCNSIQLPAFDKATNKPDLFAQSTLLYLLLRKLDGTTVFQTNEHSLRNTKMAVTDTQHLEKLRTYWKQHRAFPSMGKLCEVVGLSSTASVFYLVSRLKDAGYVERVEGRIAPAKRFFGRPLVGTVRGLPQPAPDDDFEVLTIDDYLIPDPNRTFLARVKGDSMKDAALVDGDLVVVQKSCPTRVGDIVVAVVDGQVAVKYLRQQPDGRFYLQSANTAFADIHPQGELEILGVVVGEFRAYRR